MNSGTATRAAETAFWTRCYLLGHCEGYRVSTAHARVGFVEDVVRDPETETPTALVVRARGDAGVITVPIERVAELRTGAEEIVLTSDYGEGWNAPH